jgi:hypothetical protein
MHEVTDGTTYKHTTGNRTGNPGAPEGVDKPKKNWIQSAINPSHKGYCTPMTKATCTPRRKALAMRFKKGGDLHK